MKQIIVDLFSLNLFGRHVALRIYSYGLMLVAGFLVGIYLARWRARRSGEDPDVITRCGLLALVGGIVGGRVAYVVQHWQDEFAAAADPLAAALDVTSGGLIYHGGLILATVMVIAYLRIKRLPVRRYLDIVAMSLMVGLAFGRAGCLLNGCCFGASCRADWPLGMRFPMFSKPLVKLTSGTDGFSRENQEPSPVYAHQFSLGLVRPGERLFDPGPPRRIWPPRYLHGRLSNDQVAELLDASRWEADFRALAGDDGRISEEEWRRGLVEGTGLLRGSENFYQAVLRFDRGGDGQLDSGEMRDYLEARRAWVLARFDMNGDGSLDAAERDAANAYLQEDLFALAAATRSEPVKPAQLLSLIGALVVAGLLWGFYRLRRREGQVFAFMAMLYPIVRFVEEGIRDQNSHDLARGLLTHNQVTAVAIAAAGLLLWLGLQRLPPSAGPTAAQRLAMRNSRHGRKSRT
jgi:prolipoprotein diacylglyceryl transferase